MSEPTHIVELLDGPAAGEHPLPSRYEGRDLSRHYMATIDDPADSRISLRYYRFGTGRRGPTFRFLGRDPKSEWYAAQRAGSE